MVDDGRAGRLLTDASEVPQGGAAAHAERRGEPRDLSGERARLMFGTAAVECTVLDMSTNGARVRLHSAAIVPVQVLLRLHKGEAFAARKLWNLRDQIGLLFDRAAPLRRVGTPVAVSALEALEAGGLEHALRMLRGAGLLDDFALGEAAREAEVAFARLRSVLGGLATRGA